MKYSFKVTRFGAVALSAILVAACGGGGGGGGNPAASTGGNVTTVTSTNTDTTLLATRNITSLLSLAGSWLPISASGSGLVPFWGNVKSGLAQLEGVTVVGWSYSGFNNTATSVTPVNAVFLQQQSNGTLQEATGGVLGDASTNGAGSVIVADFNGDGRDDLVFPAHNESPLILAASTAYMSRPDGGFNKIILPDAVMNHDARLVTLGGIPKIISRSFGATGNNSFNVVYTWNGSNFTVDTSLGDLGGMSVTVGKFNGDTDDYLAIGDSNFGPGIPFVPTNPMSNYLYKYANGVLATSPISLPQPYFNGKAEYSGYISQWDPYSKTHTSRLWTTDLNQDGLPDILAGEELWSAAQGLQKSAFQALINKGGLAFEDQTDALTQEYSKDSYTMDYTIRLVDIDGSGIDSIFSVGSQAYTPNLTSQSANYLLVNDGTGHMYAALHNEFAGMAPQIISYVQSKIGQSKFVNPNAIPAFLPYRTSNGLINYVAMVSTGSTISPNPFTGYYFVNVPLGINISTDFKRNITISTRNGSKNIRTFAGDDVVYRALTDPNCKIDGGLGNNKVVYPGNKSDWIISRSGGSVLIRPAVGSGGADTLKNIQKAQFNDQTVDLATIL